MFFIGKNPTNWAVRPTLEDAKKWTALKLIKRLKDYQPIIKVSGEPLSKEELKEFGNKFGKELKEFGKQSMKELNKFRKLEKEEQKVMLCQLQPETPVTASGGVTVKQEEAEEAPTEPPQKKAKLGKKKGKLETNVSK